MLLNGWGRDLNVNGSDKDQWRIYDSSWRIYNSSLIKQYNRTMLQTDLCLAYEDEKNPGHWLYANTTDCCAWTEDDYLFRHGIMIQGRDNDYCGSKI